MRVPRLALSVAKLPCGGRAAVIVPDDVLFGSSNAHTEVRRKLIEENRLDGGVSMPAGAFRPCAGVSTAILLFAKGAATERIRFYDMEHDGFSLVDKRQRVGESRDCGLMPSMPPSTGPILHVRIGSTPIGSAGADATTMRDAIGALDR
jgi:hypothetical protein